MALFSENELIPTWLLLAIIIGTVAISTVALIYIIPYRVRQMTPDRDKTSTPREEKGVGD